MLLVTVTVIGSNSISDCCIEAASTVRTAADDGGHDDSRGEAMQSRERRLG